jgi:phytoene dehydrogenase-like protein
MSSSEVVVVGAGLAGLSATLTLQEAGVSVELIDASDRAGGRVATDHIDGFTLDRGFQLINARYPELVRLDVIKNLDFIYASAAIDICLEGSVSTLGDPRKFPLSALSHGSGTLREKIAFISYLLSASSSEKSVEDELKFLGTLYSRVLKPFLSGVFLTPPSTVSALVGKEIIRSFISGKSGLPSRGVGALSLALAERVENLRLGERIDSLSSLRNRKVIVATDLTTAAQLFGNNSIEKLASSTTWYHEIPEEFAQTNRLRIDGAERGPIINSVVISNIARSYAPQGRHLLSSTTLVTTSESEVRRHLSQIWGRSSTSLELIAKYEIPKSLPIFGPGAQMAQSAKVAENIYLAGDYRTAPSQNGALLSGRLAALELLQG